MHIDLILLIDFSFDSSNVVLNARYVHRMPDNYAWGEFQVQLRNIYMSPPHH